MLQACSSWRQGGWAYVLLHHLSLPVDNPWWVEMMEGADFRVWSTPRPRDNYLQNSVGEQCEPRVVHTLHWRVDQGIYGKGIQMNITNLPPSSAHVHGLLSLASLHVACHKF